MALKSIFIFSKMHHLCCRDSEPIRCSMKDRRSQEVLLKRIPQSSTSVFRPQLWFLPACHVIVVPFPARAHTAFGSQGLGTAEWSCITDLKGESHVDGCYRAVPSISCLHVLPFLTGFLLVERKGAQEEEHLQWDHSYCRLLYWNSLKCHSPTQRVEVTGPGLHPNPWKESFCLQGRRNCNVLLGSHPESMFLDLLHWALSRQGLEQETE